MRRAVLALSLVGACFSTGSTLFGQEQRAPVANAIGRFFGFGYSAGYHAQVESRYGFHHYAPTQNLVPQPPRGVHAVPTGYGYGQPMQGMVYGQPGVTMMGAPMSAPQLPMGNMHGQEIVPAPPTKPVEPPPSWLKQFLKDQKSAAPQPTQQLPPAASPASDDLLNETSPSDQNSAYIMLSPQESVATPTQIGRRPVVSILQQ